MSSVKVSAYLFGVGASALAFYPYMIKYNERSEREI